jgi:Zn-dependent protease
VVEGSRRLPKKAMRNRPASRRGVRAAGVLLVAACLGLPGLVLAAPSSEGLALPPQLLQVVLTLPALLLGIGLHEWAHAWVAWRLGDNTPEEDGRLSLNPLDHLDPVGTLVILGAMISQVPLLGWGKPVEISPGAFRRPIVDKMKVSIAGPMMNLLIASCGLIVFHVCDAVRAQVQDAVAPSFWANLWIMLWQIVMLNFALAMFNMIPIPPLDGAKVLENFLSAPQTLVLRKIEPFGFLILVGILSTGILQGPYTLLLTAAALVQQSLAVSLTFLGVVVMAWVLLVRSLPLFRGGY